MSAETSGYGSYYDDEVEEEKAVAPKKAPPAKKPAGKASGLQDSHRHALEAIETSKERKDCCGCATPLKGKRYSCPRRICDFHFCEKCFQKAVRKGNQKDVLAVNPWLAAEAPKEVILTVDGYEAAKDQPTIFVILVRQNLPQGPVETTFRKRYSELLALHKTLAKEKTFDEDLPEFPPKKRIGKKKENFLESRQEALMTYFEKLLEITQVRFQPCFREAFKLDSSMKIEFNDNETEEKPTKMKAIKSKLKKLNKKGSKDED